MKPVCKNIYLSVLFFSGCVCVFAQDRQWVEGFDSVVFNYNSSNVTNVRDFRGNARGYMTAGWWAPGQMEKNILSWKTAPVPAKKATTFSFIGATPVLPSEILRGPQAKLSVNGKYILTFLLGANKDFTWKEGDYELKYISKRIEFPYFGTHRLAQNGNSGIFQLSVPASVVDAGKASIIQVEILPFERWNNGWFMVKERRDVLKESMESMKGEIDALRRDIATLNEQTQILATRLYGDLSGRENFKDVVVYTNGFKHLHPADLIRLKNGDIIVMTREASEHYANDGDVVMVRSKDGGKTWAGRQVVSAIKDLDEREGCGIQLKDGTIIVGVFYNNLYNPDGSYRFNYDRKILLDKNKRYLGSYIITSKDNGYTWSKPNFIESHDMPFTNVEGPTDAPIEMPDGSIVMGVIGYNAGGDEKNNPSVFLRSTDKGKTWKYVSTMASDPGGLMGGFLEPGIVRTKTGRIVSLMRNHGVENTLYATYSDDEGKTWFPAWKTEMTGHPADLIQLSDGRLMATYGIRPPHHGLPGGVRACFSNDNGKSWDINTEVQIRNDFINWDVGYPESTQLKDGSILTVYYYNLFGKYYIGATTWKL
jgi:hypothetical protein